LRLWQNHHGAWVNWGIPGLINKKLEEKLKSWFLITKYIFWEYGLQNRRAKLPHWSAKYHSLLPKHFLKKCQQSGQVSSLNIGRWVLCLMFQFFLYAWLSWFLK
jgi:hypothetical protein